MKDKHAFKKELTDLINRFSCENESNTPDYILAEYLMECLSAYETAHNDCIKWHN